MNLKVLFVINPLSGGKAKHNFISLAKSAMPSKYNSEFVLTERKGHAKEIVEKKIHDFDIFVAVGGDGTINEVGTALLHSGKLLGIIPYGSGNGLARALGIPINTEKALANLSSGKLISIDVGKINGLSFFNMGGLGFDAHISAKFAAEKKRGLLGYVRTTFQEISKYAPQSYSLVIDGKNYHFRAFMISIANSSQYGNNAHVSPQASLQDGLLDVCVIKPFPLYHFPVMVYHMFSKTAHKSKYVRIIKGRNIEISQDEAAPFHTDGEAVKGNGQTKVSILPLAIQVIA